MHLYEAEDYIGKERDRAILEKNEKRSEDLEDGVCVLLRFLGGGVPPGFNLNSNPISDQKMSFSTPVLRPGMGRNYYVIVRETHVRQT